MLVLLPISLGLGYAMLYSFGVVGALNNGFTLEHWNKVLSGNEIWTSLGFSLYIALLSVGIAVVIALILSIYFKKHLQKGVLSTFIYFPLTIPAVVMAFLSFLLFSKSGWWSRIVYNLNWINDLQQFPSIINDTYGIGIIITSVLLITPFFIILFYSIYRNEHLDKYSLVAQNLGANKWYIFNKIVLPMLLRKSAFTIGLFIIFVMSSYEVPLLLGRQYPQMVTVLSVNKLQKFNLQDIPQAYVIALLYAFLIIAFLSFYFKSKFKKIVL